MFNNVPHKQRMNLQKTNEKTYTTYNKKITNAYNGFVERKTGRCLDANLNRMSCVLSFFIISGQVLKFQHSTIYDFAFIFGSFIASWSLL